LCGANAAERSFDESNSSSKLLLRGLSDSTAEEGRSSVRPSRPFTLLVLDRLVAFLEVLGFVDGAPGRPCQDDSEISFDNSKSSSKLLLRGLFDTAKEGRSSVRPGRPFTLVVLDRLVVFLEAPGFVDGGSGRPCRYDSGRPSSVTSGGLGVLAPVAIDLLEAFLKEPDLLLDDSRGVLPPQVASTKPSSDMSRVRAR
jgi:hypothetical protein